MKDVLDDLSFERIRGLLNRHAGIELNPGKRQMAVNRLSKPMRALGVHAIADYLKLVETDQSQRQTFINAMTTNVTSFFREPHHFPLLINELRDRPESPALWSAGCSTGQEPYSLAIALCEAFPARFESGKSGQAEKSGPVPVILATDIDTQVLQQARTGLYSAAEVQTLEEPLRHKYFSHTDADHFQIRPFIRQMIEFRTHNLAAASTRLAWPPFDAIFCRNVMIYFVAAIQRDITRRFAQHLRPDGLLFAGHSEMLMHSDDVFRSLGQTVYRLRRQ